MEEIRLERCECCNEMVHEEETEICSECGRTYCFMCEDTDVCGLCDDCGYAIECEVYCEEED